MRNVGEISDGATIIRYGKTAAENLLEMVHCGKVCKFFRAGVCNMCGLIICGLICMVS